MFVVKRILVIASLALLFEAASVGQQPMRPMKERFSEKERAATLISNVLAKAGVSGSLEYNGECGEGSIVPDLPPIREPQKPYGQNPTETLRSMFSPDGRRVVSQGSNNTIRVIEMVVSQEADGMIRIIEAGVQTDILQVRIKQLSFKWITDPEEALHVVLSAPEVQSFIKTHGIGQPVPLFGVSLYELPGRTTNAVPMPGVPYVSGELSDITLADALDYLLKTFPGFWLYQDCSLEGRRIVYFSLFPAAGKMWGWGNGETWVK